MSFLGTLLGTDAAGAAKSAAADTYAKQQAATTGIQNYGDQYAGQYANLAQGYQPYVNTGYNANSQFNQLLSDPSSVASLPGYQFDLAQGQKAITGAGAGTGSLFSGKTGKDLAAFGTNLADQTYGNQFSRLMGASGQGQQALGAQNATIGQGLQGQLATRQSAYGGQMQDAGTIGQGDIAAENAKTKSFQSLLNLAGTLGGAALGGGGASSFSGLGKLFMGGGSPSGYGA